MLPRFDRQPIPSSPASVPGFFVVGITGRAFLAGQLVRRDGFHAGISLPNPLRRSGYGWRLTESRRRVRLSRLASPLRIAYNTPKGYPGTLPHTLIYPSPSLSWLPLRASLKPLAAQGFSGFSTTPANETQQLSGRPGPSHQPDLMQGAPPGTPRSAPCRCHQPA